jgi:hypothetical protein
MLSSFLKRLLLTRQLFMTEGRISMLGCEKVMLPVQLVSALESEEIFKSIVMSTYANMKRYAKQLGTDEKGLLNVSSEIFETYGVGMLERKGKDTIIIHNPPYLSDNVVTKGIVTGMFSYLLGDITVTGHVEKDSLVYQLKRGV